MTEERKSEALFACEEFLRKIPMGYPYKIIG